MLQKILLLFFVFATVLPSTAQAVGTVEFTVHHAPGGPSDKTTRVIHKHLPDGQYVVVNRPGAQGKIAVRHLMANDGLMLATMAQIYVTNQLIGADYTPDKDLTVIANIGIMPSVLVCRRDLGVKSIRDVAIHKHLTFAVAGIGSSEHIATEVLFKKINRQHQIVPYSLGGAKSIQDMLGGHVDCMFANYPTVKEWVSNEKLVTILTSHSLGLKVPTWETTYGEKFPFNATLAIVIGSQNKNYKIVEDLQRAIANPQLVSDLADIGILPTPSTKKSDIDAVLANNLKIKKAITDNNITLQQ